MELLVLCPIYMPLPLVCVWWWWWWWWLGGGGTQSETKCADCDPITKELWLLQGNKTGKGGNVHSTNPPMR